MSILNKILKQKEKEVSSLKEKYKLKDFESSPYFSNIGYSLINSIAADKNLSIVTEIKKASPSKGLIREEFNHLEIAEKYLQYDVNGISVLTDKKFFQGNIKFLNDIAAIKSKPLLRKDFIIDEYQIYEAKANGADVILLIAEALTKSRIKELTETAFKVGVEVLLELHSGDQLNKIDFTRNKLIGINNRNLEDFVTDINTTIKLKKCLPEEILVISESGISNKDDINKLKDAGVNAILVGELLMRNDIDTKLSELISWCKIEG